MATKTAKVSSPSTAGYDGTGNSLGARSENLSAIYGESPIYLGEYTDEIIQSIGVAGFNGNDGYTTSDGSVIAESGGVINDAGYFYDTFNLNYPSAPNLEDVETGEQGLPASPYYPNPMSPGPGSVSHATIPEYTGAPVTQHSVWGSGLPGTTSPSETSTNIANQTIGELIGPSTPGRLGSNSYDGSNGSS
tara:strand:+ start:650 stop:1222 length:573 start_codon:yes stop_codon:yes gene_type:complete